MHLASRALLQVRPEPVPKGVPMVHAPSEEETDEEALQAYPSTHTCLVCNVVAITDLIRSGAASRFALRGSIPAVYLSCACNFDRDEDTGEIFSYEIAMKDHQERCEEEAQQYPEVRFCLDPKAGVDWQSFFRRQYCLQTVYEVWKGDDFVRNAPQPPHPSAGLEAFPVYTLYRTTFQDFQREIQAKAAGSLGRGGCVVVFRHAPPHVEPFGMWFGWVILGGSVVVVDVQNSHVAPHLEDLIAGLEWQEPPRPEIFYAAFKYR